ncbi:MAG: hypothetical protein M1812_007278 [Candelaria pacifica]|nr:MAG: hypothetical protein M1812_007278 [Candelaria pacifica]
MLTLPSFNSIRRPRRAKQSQDNSPPNQSNSSTTSPKDTEKPRSTHIEHSKATLKRATRTRKIFSLLTSFFFLISVVFLVLVEIGNTHIRPVLRNTYFLKLDLSHIIPRSVPNSVLINSIARTLGLHDFYQVGLWNFCEGYTNSGVTSCGKPRTLYWFNPVEILLNELLAGATIALPEEIISVLNIVKTASHYMFALFLLGICLSSFSIILMPFSIYSRWASLPTAILSFLAALATTAATIIATVMFIIFRNVFTTAPEVNINAELGIQMFAFMWIASGFGILAWLVQMGMCCCCASRRDVKKGKKRGSSKAYAGNEHQGLERSASRRSKKGE